MDNDKDVIQIEDDLEDDEEQCLEDDVCDPDDIDSHDEDEFEDTDDEEFEEPDDEDGEDDFEFDIEDHLNRIMSLFGLGKRDGFPDGISGLLSKMLSPHIMSSLPFSDVTLDDEDLDSADKAHGKMVIMHGKKSGDEPMKVKVIKKNISPIDLDEDEESIKKISRKVSDRLSAIREFSKNVRTASVDVNSVITDRLEYINLLKDGFDIAHRFADARGDVDSVMVSDLIACINPGEYRKSIPSSVRKIVSEVISDLAMYSETEGFFRSAAERIKLAYRGIVDGKEGMSRIAYYEVRNAPSEEAEGYNPCPKFKSSGVEVPVEWNFCRDYCVEGKQQEDGSVECKFSSWLEKVADSHEKAMNRLNEQKNPVNEHMRLRIPDGQKENPKREIDTHIEVKFEKEGKHGRKWDDAKPKDGLAGRHMNVEALIDEMLDGSGPRRTDSGNESSTEKKLRESSSSDLKDSTMETKLEDKHDDAAYSNGRSNEETLIAEVRPKRNFDTDKLLDELIQDAFPRDHEKRPKR